MRYATEVLSDVTATGLARSCGILDEASPARTLREPHPLLLVGPPEPFCDRSLPQECLHETIDGTRFTGMYVRDFRKGCAVLGISVAAPETKKLPYTHIYNILQVETSPYSLVITSS